MARVFLIALAVIAAVLGFLMDNVLLLGIAGAFLVLALVTLAILAVKRRRRREEAERTRELSAVSREEELRAVGISGIRPKTGPKAPVGESEEPPSSAASEPSPKEKLASDVPAPLATEPASAPAAEPVSEKVEASASELSVPEEPHGEPLPMYEAREDSPFWRMHSPTAVTSYLRALWASTDVQTVALFSSDASGDAYTLEAALSHNPHVRREGRFPSADHLLEAVSSERPLTVLEANDPLIRTLPYYKRAVHVGGAAVLPLRNADDTTAYLVVDLQQDQTGFSDRQRDLLLRHADLLSALLAHPEEVAPNQRATPTRRSIIAAEMEQARTAERPLALALVYRTDAEQIAERGTDAVVAAERDLRLHLEDLTPEGRVERFSELVYGAFLYDAPDAIEAWLREVRTQGAAHDIPLVAGVARLTTHHDPDELRADAFNALQLALAEREDYVIA